MSEETRPPRIPEPPKPPAFSAKFDFAQVELQAILSLVEIAWRSGSVKSEQDAQLLFALKAKAAIMLKS